MTLSTIQFHDPGDRDLERRVTAFLAEKSVPGLRQLEVESRRGVVTLRGRVRTYYEKQLGGHLTRRVAGVVQLIDLVQVDNLPARARPIAEGPRRQARVAAWLPSAGDPRSGIAALQFDLIAAPAEEGTPS